MFQEWIEEYFSFEKELTEVIKKNKGDIKNAYARVNIAFNPQTLDLESGELVVVCAETRRVVDEEIAEMSFILMRKLINDGYMKYKYSLGNILLYAFDIEKFIDFDKALEE